MLFPDDTLLSKNLSATHRLLLHELLVIEANATNNSTSYCYFSLLPIITRWYEPIADDTTYFSDKAHRNQS